MSDYPEPPSYFPSEVEPGSPRRRDGDTTEASVYHLDSKASLFFNARFHVPRHSHSGSAHRQTPETHESGYKSRTCSNPNCETTSITSWRHDRGEENLCGACSSFQHLHGKDSPVTLRNDDIIKDRKRSLSIESVERASSWPPAGSPISKARRLDYIPRHNHASQSAHTLGLSPAGSPISQRRQLECNSHSDHACQSPYMLRPDSKITQVSQSHPEQAAISSTAVNNLLIAQLRGQSPYTLGSNSDIAQVPQIRPEQTRIPSSTAVNHFSTAQHNGQRPLGQFYIPHPSLKVYDHLPWHALRDVQFMIERIPKLTDEDKCKILRFCYGKKCQELQHIEEDQIADIYKFCKSVCATGRRFFEKKGAPGQDTIAANLERSLWAASGERIEVYVRKEAEGPVLGTHLDHEDLMGERMAHHDGWIGEGTTPSQVEMMKKEDEKMKGLLRPTLTMQMKAQGPKHLLGKVFERLSSDSVKI